MRFCPPYCRWHDCRRSRTQRRGVAGDGQAPLHETSREKNMKRNHFVIVTVVCVMLWSLNSFQGAQVQPFDLRKCQQELEIMKGILRTTLGIRVPGTGCRPEERQGGNQARGEALHVWTQRGLQHRSVLSSRTRCGLYHSHFQRPRHDARETRKRGICPCGCGLERDGSEWRMDGAARKPAQ